VFYVRQRVFGLVSETFSIFICLIRGIRSYPSPIRAIHVFFSPACGGVATRAILNHREGKVGGMAKRILLAVGYGVIVLETMFYIRDGLLGLIALLKPGDSI
jgi:hypothetical protein